MPGMIEPPIKEIKFWRDYTNWDGRFTKATYFPNIFHILDVTNFLQRPLTIGYDADIKRQFRMKELAACYAFQFVLPHVEAKELIKRYEYQVDNGRLDSDLVVFKGDELTFRNQLQKADNYLADWRGRLQDARDSLLKCMVKNFTKKEIDEVIIPTFRQFLIDSLFDKSSEISAIYSKSKIKDYDTAYDETEEILDFFTNDLRECVSFLRSSLANKEANEDFKMLDEMVSRGHWSKRGLVGKHHLTKNSAWQRQGLFENLGDNSSDISDPIGECEWTPRRRGFPTNTAPTSGGASATHEPQSNMRLGT